MYSGNKLMKIGVKFQEQVGYFLKNDSDAHDLVHGC